MPTQGGKEAGLVRDVDNALTRWLPQNHWDYVAGLEAVNESSKLMFDKRFAELKWEQRTKALEAMESGEAIRFPDCAGIRARR